ncbi:MAG TPA: RNase III inhibitor [Clostridiales bacterium]|nr:RNase III inhibitor [Clostridiales bacterium]
MPFELVRNDIAEMTADAIVNTANPQPIVGHGVDAAIHKKAGPQLLQARKALGQLRVGQTALTPAFGLNARYVIHVVGPLWQGGGRNEVSILRQCYQSALELAKAHGCRSIAFPLLCAGTQGFPPALALQTAIGAFSSFLVEEEMQIYLAVFDTSAFTLSEKLFQRVASYIDEHYIEEKIREEFDLSHSACQEDFLETRRELERRERMYIALRLEEDEEERLLTTSLAPEKPLSLPQSPQDWEAILPADTPGFSQTLLALIDRTGKRDAEIYKKANIDRKHFSKIRSNPHYHPSKSTVLAFALALELDLEETKDLLCCAGYALSRSQKRDVIVEFFLRQGHYDLMEINQVLFHFQQPLIGG